MNIALDISPLSEKKNSQHSVRGVGSYTKNLKKSLETYVSNNTYAFFDAFETVITAST